MGLLTKANLVDLNTRLAFSDFVYKYELNSFSIFSKIENDYYISNSLGMDGVSIIGSTSTPDFWKGICKNLDTVYNFDSSDKANPLLQFFSFKLKDEIRTISVCRTSKNILMLCNKQITSEMLRDYLMIDDTKSLLDVSKLNNLISKSSILCKVQIDFDEAIQTFIYTKLTKKDYAELFSKSLFNELSNRILFAYNEANTSVKSFDNKIKTVFIANTSLSKEILINHLILNYKDVLENAAEVINIDFLGNAESFSELKDFLQVE